MMAEDYKSVEEFINREKRYPNSHELQSLQKKLWDKYISCLDESEKHVALENRNVSKQSEILRRIPAAAERLRQQLLADGKDIIAVGYYERWGDYRLHVGVNSKSEANLHLFRKVIPNFFEGWYVALSRGTRLQRLLFRLREYRQRDRRSS